MSSGGAAASQAGPASEQGEAYSWLYQGISRGKLDGAAAQIATVCGAAHRRVVRHTTQAACPSHRGSASQVAASAVAVGLLLACGTGLGSAAPLAACSGRCCCRRHSDCGGTAGALLH